MKKINEAESRTLNGGLEIGLTAKRHGNMPNGYLFYAYCEKGKRSVYTNDLRTFCAFVVAHRHK